ncbi:MAG: 4-hydroxy-tetrahydrodipicolinate reductase [Clostridiales bacterium]|jgi:4-hydroxy-tetrahydrodipicolinate reductase|nr:4-hydroxy-tetrahydrodipicolinate reductase [Clostridiales bacterium]
MRLIINGCNGKMGNILCKMAIEKKYDICGVTPKDFFSNDFKVYKNIEKIDDNYDVVIDFSHNDAVESVINYCLDKRINAVICTTGLSEKINDIINKASEKIAILKSSNASMGINLINLIIKKISPLMKEFNFDIDILEKHHNRKPDAPSGTALFFANTINKSLDNKLNIKFDDKNYVRKKNDLFITSIRSGNSKGEHSVSFENDSESITIKHKAYSREIFAQGALKSAEFIKDKKTGLFSTYDIYKNLL